jgi:hypothetical protein
VAGLVGVYAFPVFLSAVGEGLAGYAIAGGLTGIVAGQASVHLRCCSVGTLIKS